MYIKTYQRVDHLIPDKNRALDLLIKSGCSEDVIQHCLIVSDYAKEISQKIKEYGYCVDVELVQIGALLHDIGRSKTHDIRHGVEGGLLAKQYALDERLVRIIITHIGAGITNNEAKSLGFAPGNYIPLTLEEMIVAHADNLVDDNHIISISEKIEMLKKKGMHENIIKRIVELHDKIDGMLH